jgi:DNA repair exonuclease SbcCD ATPase subunit
MLVVRCYLRYGLSYRDVGGETFLASLALALAVVLLANTAGGCIERCSSTKDSAPWMALLH